MLLHDHSNFLLQLQNNIYFLFFCHSFRLLPEGRLFPEISREIFPFIRFAVKPACFLQRNSSTAKLIANFLCLSSILPNLTPFCNIRFFPSLTNPISYTIMEKDKRKGESEMEQNILKKAALSFVPAERAIPILQQIQPLRCGLWNFAVKPLLKQPVWTAFITRIRKSTLTLFAMNVLPTKKPLIKN